MKKTNNIKKMLLWVLLLLPALLTLKPETVQATHFRFGHLTWAPLAGSNNVRFTLVNAFRRADNDYPGSYSDGYVDVGDIINETIGGTGLNYGDGNSTGILQYKVISIDVANDWFLAQALEPGSSTKTSLDHQYATPNNAGSPWIAEINSCCRTGVELNNPGVDYRVFTTVDLSGTNRSPSSSLPAIVNLPFTTNASFFVTAADPDPNTVLTFRLATPGEASGSNNFTQPTGLAINFLTGQVTWNTQANAVIGGLYSVQIIIEDRAGASTAPLKTQVGIDFLIYIIPQSSPCDVNTPPQFTAPSPTCGTLFTRTEGQALTFTVAANDVNDDTITLNSAGIPTGATLTPVLPVQGNPVSTVFNWTPSAGQAGGYVVTFIVTDSCGAQSLCSYSIQVNPSQCNLKINCITTQPTCWNTCDGSVSVTATGGSGHYGYSWSNGQTTSTATGLCAQAYTVTVLDSVTQCTKSKTFILKKAKVTHKFTSVIHPTCGLCNGFITVEGRGGNGGPYTFVWSTGATTATIGPLCPGTYTVTITDTKGCTVICRQKIVNKNINCPSRLAEESEDVKQIHAYPNPFNSVLKIDVITDELLTIRVRDLAGRIVNLYSNVNQSFIMDSKLNNGLYFLEIENDSGSYRKVMKVIRAD